MDPAICLPLILGLSRSIGCNGSPVSDAIDNRGVQSTIGNVEPTDEQLSQFLAFTGSTDSHVARQYLEMSGKNLEMAASLFFEHGGEALKSIAAGGGDATILGEVRVNDGVNLHGHSMPFPPTHLPSTSYMHSVKPQNFTAATKIVCSALKEYWAFRTLRRNLLTYIHHRRSQRDQSFSTKSSKILSEKSSHSSISLHFGTSHFLFQSLLHPSIRVRNAAGRMLIENIHLAHDSDTMKRNVLLLREVLVILFHNLLFGECPFMHQQPYFSPHPEGSIDTQLKSHLSAKSQPPITFDSSIYQQANGGDPAIQVMAMLVSLVCDGCFSSFLVAKEMRDMKDAVRRDANTRGYPVVDSKETILCNSLLKELGANSIESFVASGGLRWACACILRLARMLVYGKCSNICSTDHSEKRESDNIQNTIDINQECHVNKNDTIGETIKIRLVLLVDLVYRLVLFGSVPAAVEKYDVLTGTRSSIEEGEECGGKSNSSPCAAEKEKSRRKMNGTTQFSDIPLKSSRVFARERSRLLALRQYLRSSLASGPTSSSPSILERNTGDKSKFVNSTNSDAGGDGYTPGSILEEENRRRRDRRKDSLERVHNIFWSTNLPAAIFFRSSISHLAEDGTDINGSSENLDEIQGNLSPYACLIAAYEILRCPSTLHGSVDSAINKSISFLSRLIDPSAGQAFVVSEDTHIELAKILSDGIGKGIDKVGERITKETCVTRKRDHSSSYLSQDSYRSRSSSRLGRSTPASNTRIIEDCDQPVKRKRIAKANVSTLLERLTQVNSSIREEIRESLGSPQSFATAVGRGERNSLFASRFSSSMESMLRGSNRGISSSSAALAHKNIPLNRIITAAEGRAGRREGNNTIRSHAVLDGRSSQEKNEWSIINLECDEEDDNLDGDGLIMMEEDEDTEFDQEEDDDDEELDGDIVDEPDDQEDCDEGENEDCDDDDNGDDTDDGCNGDEFFDDAVIVMDQVVTACRDGPEHHRNNPHRESIASREVSPRLKGYSNSAVDINSEKNEREKAYLHAAMQVLSAAEYPREIHRKRAGISHSPGNRVHTIFTFGQQPAVISSPLLPLTAEQYLLQSICDVIKPPRKPLNLKIFMKRAPTQEEFFRGSLSRNPINLSSLKTESLSREDQNDEPSFGDLRRYIAKDLQMEDSAELLELLVANKIMDMNLKLRVAQQVLWKKYVLENSTGASSLISGVGPGHQMINTGLGLSMIFSGNSLTGRVRESGSDELNVGQLPPMVCTYRLAGVDGEATEDKVASEDLEDPEAPVSTLERGTDQRMEKEFSITKLITHRHESISIILASINAFTNGITTRIRRDEVATRRQKYQTNDDVLLSLDENKLRAKFSNSPPCPGLTLLRLCSNLAENRRKLIAARAPMVLLRLLLDILNAMNRSSFRRSRSITLDQECSSSTEVDDAENVSREISTFQTANSSFKGNPTTNALQEIIEMLASDISDDIPNEVIQDPCTETEQNDNDGGCDTLPLVLASLRSTKLNPPLQKVIARLLPFLTYGKLLQSQELASYFIRYVKLESFSERSQKNLDSTLMNTFLQAAIDLPPVNVCDNLRQALISNGFVEKLSSFVIMQSPSLPPPWSSALYPKMTLSTLSQTAKIELKEEWGKYFNRPGLSKAFQVLIGLCSKHAATQMALVGMRPKEIGSPDKKDHSNNDLLTLCHWIESTSDNDSSGVGTNGLGLLAETLIDALKEGNEKTADIISALRKMTRERKRQIAEERRNKALVSMSVLSTIAGSTAVDTKYLTSSTSVTETSGNRATSILTSMLDFSVFRPQSSTKSSKADTKNQPSWINELEALDDEDGVTCAICQEGRTIQPSELLGLYAYMKKVFIPSSQGGGKCDIDGTMLLLSLPLSFPRSVVDSSSEFFFQTSKVAVNALHGTPHALAAIASASSSISSANSNNRTNNYITTVSAGNAIHCSCHVKAKAADRSHPKAPKSEWDGASLRNSRVTCNVILPLISSKPSKISFTAVENALADVKSAITTILGLPPKSMLWNVLHDIRFLLLRMSYGEPLNADCGGGSSSSNFLLLLYQLHTAVMLSKKKYLNESLDVTKHAKGLSMGFLAAVSIIDAADFDRYDVRSKKLERAVADAAPMSALCSILFFNWDNENAATGEATDELNGTNQKTPLSLPQWEIHKSKFLIGLIRCAGHRHALGVIDSGCVSTRGILTGSRKNVEKSRSFTDWSTNETDKLTLSYKSSQKNLQQNRAMIEDYSAALRPMITLYAIFDQLSKEFKINASDQDIESSSEQLASKLESCYKTSSIHALFDTAEVTMDHDKMCKYFEKGALS